MPTSPKRHSARDQTAALLSKHGLVVRELARTLLDHAPGERIGRVQEHARRFSASAGTVQAALDYIQGCGAATLEARGRLGTFTAALDYPLLWALALNRPVVGVLPLPFSRRFAGLATGIRDQFARRPVDLDMRFMRGAGRRMEALAAGTGDWALVSRFAAESAPSHGFAIETVALLGPGTYMARHALLLRADGAGSLQDGMRVGVDLQSTDHVSIIHAISRDRQVELVEIEYSQGLRLLAEGRIDATVWSEEDLPADPVAFTLIPLDARTTPAIALLGEAALIVAEGNRAAAHLLGAALDLEELRQVQAAVVAHARLPGY